MQKIWNEDTDTHGFHQEFFPIQLASKKTVCQQMDWNDLRKIWSGTNSAVKMKFC